MADSNRTPDDADPFDAERFAAETFEPEPMDTRPIEDPPFDAQRFDAARFASETFEPDPREDDQPGADRWVPTRAGIRNIWEYDDQIFDFADGRLVLRGPNGSGKSNALALLVPFLLDGVMAANRMDSLGGGRSMKTLLLCLNDDERANRFRHEQRTGYAWLELERNGDYTTIGCGARASTQRDAEAWFFVTSWRVGTDLDLAPGGVPLSRRALAEVVGADAVHDTAEAYRTAVDRALFGLGAHRYRNLIELLLVLRRPHLAGRLNLEHLSKVMSDGLAALDDQLIVDVAASFEDLEAVQRDLSRLREAHQTVKSFLPVYRSYLRAVACSRALVATEAERALRAARRRVGDARKAIKAADVEVERVRTARLATGQRREIAEQRHRAVLESPAYRDAKSLVEVEGRAADAERAAAKAADRRADTDQDATHATEEATHAATDRRGSETATEQAFAATGESADQAGIAWAFSRGDVESADLQRNLRSMGRERRQDIADVRAAVGTADAASVRATAAGDSAAASAETADGAEAAREGAATAVDAARETLAGEVRSWVEAGRVPELGAVVTAVDQLGEPGAPGLKDVLTTAVRPIRERLASRAARVLDRERAITKARVDAIDERRRIADDPVPAPDRRPTRPADRTGRAGAPFFACVDFADHVRVADRTGIEAAMEASGLLDAWIGEGSTDLDAWIEPGPPVEAASLAEVLIATPPAGSRLGIAQIRGVLFSIALADTGIAVLPDGRFRLGPLQGRFHKEEAGFIGATAREQRRQRRLADLDARIAVLTAELRAVGKERQRVASAQARLDEIAGALPSPQALLSARDGLLGAVATAQATRAAADRDREAARAARREADQATGALRILAGERRLPSTAEDLGRSEQLIQTYEQHATDLVGKVTHLLARRAAEQVADARHDRAHARAADARREEEELRREAAGLAARVEQLRSQLGADADAPLRELGAIEDELRELRHESGRLDHDADGAAERRGAAGREQEMAAADLGGHVEVAGEAAGHLDVLRRTDVWPAVTAPDPPALPAVPADLAAVVLRANADGDTEPDENALQKAYRLLLDELRRGYNPGLTYVDHVGIVEVTSDTGTFSVLWLADELEKQVDHQEELLSERDREIFERHLLTRVSEALRELLNDADEHVTRINQLLADRPTASGKTVHLRWELDSDDPNVRRALTLLRKTPELLGPDEREQLRRFFSTAIHQRRAEDAASGYAQILRHVLDYRAWHAFVPHVRSAGGGIQRLTRGLFRTLSGGEQAVMLHLPLFAAAAAHYDLAPGAPRLVALDEAFAGIDEGMRAELMGLLVRFDLDVVLTGHELWGAYGQVPAVMVYDLLRQPPLEGVSAFAVRWDGLAMSEV